MRNRLKNLCFALDLSCVKRYFCIMKNSTRLYPIRSLVVLALCSMLFVSCRDENPDLIDPPYGQDSVAVRLYNGVFDGELRSLEFEGYEIAGVSPGAFSSRTNIGIDSSLVTLYGTQDLEYQTTRRVKMPRNSSLLFFGLDTLDGQRADTLVYTLASPVNESFPDPLISVINVNPVTERSYSVRLGCPNGSVVASDLDYMSQTFPVTIDTGRHTISILQRQVGMPQEIVGYFEFDVRDGDRLTLMACKNEVGEDEFLLVDMFSLETNPLRTLLPVDETSAEIKVVNMSSTAIDAVRNESESIVANLPSNTATEFVSLTVCNSLAPDIISAHPAGQQTGGTAQQSLQVASEYTVFVGDTADADAASVVLASPFTVSPDANSIAIRTVSLLPPTMKVNVSLGMRSNINDITSAGTALASDLSGGESTNSILIPAGPLPITVITDGNPERLTNAVYYEPQAGASYTLLLHMKDGSPQISILQEGPATQPELVNEGVFVQLVDVRVSGTPTTFTLGSVIRNAEFADGGSSATVLPEGEHECVADLTTESISASVGERVLIIATGSQSNPEIVVQSYTPLLATENEYKYRFVHASVNSPKVTVALDTRADIATTGLDFGGISGASTGVIERSYSLLFFDDADVEGDPVFQADNIAFVKGSANTIIFGGTNEEHVLVIQQEF